MKIVIDIPKKTYNEIKDGTMITCGETFAKKLIGYIRNGTPLPEHHGRLIDENDLKTLYGLDDRLWWGNAVEEFTDLPTIIEAEGSESE